QPRAFLSRRPAGEIGYWRAAPGDRGVRLEEAAPSPRAGDPPPTARGEEYFRRFDDENAAVEDDRLEGWPGSGGGRIADLKSAAPGPAGDGTSRAVPAPRFCRLTLTERVQGGRVAPVHPDVF